MPDYPHGLGAKPSIPDHRDLIYPMAAGLDQPVDLRADMPYVWDQGQLGSCVPHGVLAAVNNAEKRSGIRQVSGSALFTYYVGRDIEGTTDYDSGLYVRDGIKAANKGVADRWAWPYDIERFTEQPPQHAYDSARHAGALTYSRVINGTAGIAAALRESLPVVIGMTVYPSIFDVDSSGIINVGINDEAPAGGHCMLIVGYIPSADRYILRNSWSTAWGDEGYGYLAVVDFLRDAFTSDLWVVNNAS